MPTRTLTGIFASITLGVCLGILGAESKCLTSLSWLPTPGRVATLPHTLRAAHVCCQPGMRDGRTHGAGEQTR
ncbi:hypothetical protein F5144DRAFT_565323 [Chaetomium tenue]|uniref:Uncharacterized protein n=1 Tax=Chaetomium tenue TaxID=1854479 RepID=A0ACB7PDK2_9PEZI|nr:hypothetical protein F5144DRAFT_565323 [Chaetomium globosum]